MNRIKTGRINYYILMSALIHFCLFLFVKKEKEITLGKKIIPVEVIDNFIDPGFGEATQRSKRLIKVPSLKKDSKKAKINKNLSDDQELIKENVKGSKNIFNNKNILQKEKSSRSERKNKSLIKEKIGSGSKSKTRTNEPEKGSLKGTGKIKITCLKCIRPKYPPIALRRGAEGTPIVKVWINRNGIVTKVEFISLSGIKSIDNAAKKAAIASTFYPLEKESTINIEYDLKIK